MAGRTNVFDIEKLQTMTRNGDWEPLRKYIRDGWPLDGEEYTGLRTLLNDILEGKLKRPNNRPISYEPDDRTKVIAAYVYNLKQCGERKFIKKTMEAFGLMDDKIVRRAVADCKGWMNPDFAEIILTVTGHRKPNTATSGPPGWKLDSDN